MHANGFTRLAVLFGAVGLISCSDSSGPANGTVQLGLMVSTTGTGATAAGFAPESVTVGQHRLVLTKVELVLHEANIPELRDVQKVDERLVLMAKSLGARVVTNDYNLNKIAQLQGVEVINLNELANALKSVALPGEVMTVRLVKAGDQIGQGVGYLEDGTMVVVEQGRPAIGQEVSITVTSVLQTPAGRMIFGRIEARSAPAGSQKSEG